MTKQDVPILLPMPDDGGIFHPTLTPDAEPCLDPIQESHQKAMIEIQNCSNELIDRLYENDKLHIAVLVPAGGKKGLLTKEKLALEVRAVFNISIGITNETKLQAQPVLIDISTIPPGVRTSKGVFVWKEI